MTRPLNRLRVILDSTLTAANALDRACDAHADSVVFVVDSPLPYAGLTDRSVTPRQLLSFVNRLGNVLLQAGMRPRDRVAIFKTNGPDYFFLALAIVKAGGVAVPINSGMRFEQLSSYIGHIGCRLLITDAVCFRSVIRDPSRLPCITTWLFADEPPGTCAAGIAINQATQTASTALEPADLQSDSMIMIAHTSGTTGLPKAVVTTSGSVVRALKGHYADEPITRSNRTAVAGYFNHLVYQVGFYSSMMGNLPVWTLTSFDPNYVLDTLERERINIFFAFPDVYSRLYYHGLDGPELAAMRIWVTTAAPSREVQIREFCRKGGYLRIGGRAVVRSVFVDNLGTSEIGFSALRRVRFFHSPLSLKRCVGRPSLAGPKVRIADARGRSLAAHELGHISVKGPTLFQGYWSENGVVPARYEGWWDTADLGYKDRLGRFYHLDRDVDVVRTTGGDVHTLVVEDILLTHPAIAEGVVFGTKGGEGDVAVACVVPRRGSALDVEECRDWINARIWPRDAIAEVVSVRPDDLPRGLTGKVLKAALRDRHRQPLEA